MVSPRLVVDPGPHDVLKSFPDFIEWPAIVKAARFEVDFGGASAIATLVSAPDDKIYARLFSGSTAVLSRTFEDRRGTFALSYPVATVERDLADVYGQLAVAADSELPSVDDMRRDFQGLGRSVLAETPDGLLKEIRDGGVREAPTPADRLNLVDLYNTPLSSSRIDTYHRRGLTDPREDVSWETYETVPLPAADTFKRTIDFHQIVTALAQYPVLLRSTGLVVDLEIERADLPAGPTTAPLSLRVGWESSPGTPANGVTVLTDIAARTMTRLDGDSFEAASTTPGSPPIIEGFLRLDGDTFTVTQVDINGSALKLRHFAVNMFQLPVAPSPRHLAMDDVPVDPVDVPPDRTGTPALRSGGLTLAQSRRGKELEAKFGRSGAMEDALTNATPIDLYQEDLVRGFHVEVLDETVGKWRSLCRRDSQYTFTSDHTTLVSDDHEGILRLAASQAADGSNANVVKVHEGLFTWSGWSLAAPPIGRAIGTSDAVTDPDGLAPDGLPLDVEHDVHPRSLPSLRFGRDYQFRVRIVDLAGNALPFDPERPSPQVGETWPVTYRRFEPIEAPTVALVGLDPSVDLPGPGEDLSTAAIRSLNATFADNTVPTLERSRRHVVPPLGSQRLVELHGMIDSGGRTDPARYPLLVARDGALTETIHPQTGKGFPTMAAGSGLPFLPDPLAVDCIVRIAGRLSPTSIETVRVPWYRGNSAWPDAKPFRIEGLEVAAGASPSAPVFHSAEGVLLIPLAKADHVRVRVAHLLSDEALALLGVWHWAVERMPADVSARNQLLELARSGQHWMLTPWRDLEFVHAVQRPLVVPAIQQLAILRPTGRTVASVMFTTPLDSRSTEKLDLFGRWLEPVDDPAEAGPRARIGGGARAAELKLRRLEAPGFSPPGRRTWSIRNPVHHEFGDTRYRRIGYKLTATTRHTKFMPPPLQEPSRADELRVTSDETVGWVPNSAPPPPPDVVYVIPTFGWSRWTTDEVDRSWRDGGGLRVYLRRPWLVSGYMEMLGVVLPRAGERSATSAMAPFVTRWGEDPTRLGTPLPTVAPNPGRFALAVTQGPIAAGRLDPMIPEREGELPPGPFQVTGLPLPTAPGAPLVDVVPHLVGWDPDRRLWYADIVIEPGETYAPFIRLALARYHPISAPGSHLSGVAASEVLQLLPDRLAVVTRLGRLRYRVGVFGHGPDRANEVDFTIERLPAGAGDLGWERMSGVSIDATPSGRVGRRRTVFDTGRGRRSGAAAERSTRATSVIDSIAREARDLLAARRFEELVLRADLLEALRPPTLREVEITLPRAAQDGEQFRLVIAEAEVRSVDAEHLRPRPPSDRDPRRRIIYLETFELT